MYACRSVQRRFTQTIDSNTHLFDFQPRQHLRHRVIRSPARRFQFTSSGPARPVQPQSAPQFHPQQPPNPAFPQTPKINKPPPGRPYTYDASARSFHPAFVGVVAGSIVSSGCFYTWYVVSGAKELLQSAKEKNRWLDAQRKRFFPARRKGGGKISKEGADGKALSEEEQEQRIEWFKSTADTYASFVPDASSWLSKNAEKLQKVRDRGGQKKREEVDAIIEQCVEDLEKTELNGLNKKSAKEAWNILYGSLNKVIESGESGAASAEAKGPALEPSRIEGSQDIDAVKKSSGWFSGRSKTLPAEERPSVLQEEDVSIAERDQRAQRRSGWFRSKSQPQEQEPAPSHEPIADDAPATKKMDREAQMRAAWLKSRGGRD